MTGIVYTHRINILFLVICVCTLGIKYCHHSILFLSLCRHIFDAFSCNIHHEERYLKFADISFENIDMAKKYRDNINTFLRRYPSPTNNRPLLSVIEDLAKFAHSYVSVADRCLQLSAMQSPISAYSPVLCCQ